MITTVALVNTFITSHIYRFFFVVRTFRSKSFSNFQGYNLVINSYHASMLLILSLDLGYLSPFPGP